MAIRLGHSYLTVDPGKLCETTAPSPSWCDNSRTPALSGTSLPISIIIPVTTRSPASFLPRRRGGDIARSRRESISRPSRTHSSRFSLALAEAREKGVSFSLSLNILQGVDGNGRSARRDKRPVGSFRLSQTCVES